MLEFWNQLSPEAQEWINAALILAAFVVAAILVRLIWNSIFARIARRTATTLDDILIVPLRRLAVWTLLLAGVYFAIQSLSATQDSKVLQPIIDRAFSICWVILAIATALNIFGLLINLKIEQVGEDARDEETRLAFLRKLVTAVVWVIGAIYLLHAGGVDISPLLAGGAVGGLVLGLALQDTLSNIFAGFFLNMDRPVKIGDLVKIEEHEGFVEEIGWRYTKIRLWSNSLVVVPNSKLSQSILTNFNLPVENTSVYVYCGVAYDSDLEKVERIALEVANQAQEQEDGADRTWEPVVRFQEFGDSSINFMVVLRATDPVAQFRIKSEYIKRLHRRFNEEGIEIPFPIRTIVHKTSAEASAAE